MCREIPCPYDGMCSQRKTWERLKEYEDAEQDGKIVVLPCRKGEKLFVLTNDSLSGIEETKCKNIFVVNRESGPEAKVVARCVYDDWGGAVREFWPDDFGKTVFLTREEAEAALAGKAPDAPIDDPEWKRRMMQTFLGGR